MKIPKYAGYANNKNTSYPIESIHYDTRLVTLRESDFLNVYNTLNIRDVNFCFDGFTQEEIDEFNSKFKPFRELCKDNICKEISNEEILLLKKFINKIKETWGAYDDEYQCNFVYMTENELDQALGYFIDEEFKEKKDD